MNPNRNQCLNTRISQEPIEVVRSSSNMRLNLEISRGNKLLERNVSVGNGNASIKWLALMASQRFASEVPNSEGLAFSRPLPKNVFTKKLSFLHPDKAINQVLRNEELVYVELYDVILLDEHCIPKYHPWSIIAFQTSPERADCRARLIEEKEQEVKDIDEGRLREVEEQRVASNLPKIKKMKDILRGHISDQDRVEASMKNEWALIINSGVLDSIVPNQKEQDKIHQQLLANYAELSHMFKFYSAVNSQGGTHTLEFIEFSKIVHDTRILSGENANVILKFFGADPKTTNIHSEINLWEFFVSYIKIAIYKYLTLPKKEKTERKNKGRRTAISKVSSLTHSQAVSLLYDDHFLPIINRLPGASVAIQNSLESEECLLLLHENLENLVKIFCTYAETPFHIHDMDKSIHEGAMNIKQFSSFTSFFLSRVRDEEGLTMKDVRQVFSASQHDEASNEAESQLEHENVESHQELMVFPEFIEAVVRLSVLISDDSMPHLDSIKLTLSRIKEHE